MMNGCFEVINGVSDWVFGVWLELGLFEIVKDNKYFCLKIIVPYRNLLAFILHVVNPFLLLFMVHDLKEMTLQVSD